MYRTTNIALDMLCFCIFITVLGSALFEKRGRSKAKHYFVMIIISTIMLIIGDSCDWIFSGKAGTIYHYIMWFGLELFYLFSGFLLNSLINYLKCIIEKRGTVSPIFSYIGKGIIVYYVLFCLATIFTKSVFYIDEFNVYKRGSLFLVSQIPVALYSLIILMVIIYRKSLIAKERIFFIMLTLSPAVGEILQVIKPGIAFLMPTMTIGLLFLFIFVQTNKEFDESEMLKAELEEEKNELNLEIEKKNKMIMQDMHALTKLSEIRRGSSLGHSIRVGNYTREIAYRLGLDEDFQIGAYYAGKLHDIGMITVSENLENKQGKLTDEEYEKVKLHTIAGYFLVKEMTEYPLLIDTVRWHHEKYDGSGYPNGLKGENIPLVARIVAVANAYDAMTSNRPYRKKMTQKQVIDQLESNSGTQFDPKIVDIMLEMINEDTGYEMQEVVKNSENSILVVDDDVVVHDIVENALMDDSYSVTCASSGQEAIELMKLEEFSICLLDIQMPGMSGFDVLDWINRNKKNVQIIFLTEDKNIETIRMVQGKGAVDYVTKPISFTGLRECIKSTLTLNK